jgi:alginate O-acetyltransferase complex protein AlgI
MFGFRFLENFNYPYISQSVTEFWRRWHISLSTWFRDYLYIPLGGNRVAPWRTYLNLIIVFFLCGLWHGASVNFIVWGLYYGLFLVVERMGLARRMSGWSRPLRHVYLLLVVMVGWVFFRSNTVADALGLLRVMAGFSGASGVENSLAQYVDAEKLVAIVVGILGSGPILAAIRHWLDSNFVHSTAVVSGAVEVVGLGGILLASAMLLAAGTYNPFIYFRF